MFARVIGQKTFSFFLPLPLFSKMTLRDDRPFDEHFMECNSWQRLMINALGNFLKRSFIKSAVILSGPTTAELDKWFIAEVIQLWFNSWEMYSFEVSLIWGIWKLYFCEKDTKSVDGSISSEPNCFWK